MECLSVTTIPQCGAGGGGLLAIVSGTATIALVAIAWRQTTYWRNGEAVWTRAASCTEQNLLAHFFLAVIRDRQGRTEEAITHLREALAVDSPHRANIVRAHDLLAECLVKQGKIDEALTHYEQAGASSQRAWSNMLAWRLN